MSTKVVVLTAVAVLAVAAVGGVLLMDRDQGSDADITIACGTKNCYEPFWIADHYGLYEKNGVKVKTNYFDGGGNAMTSLLNGTSDLTLVGADPAIRMFETTDAGYAIATVETSKSGTASNDFAYLESLESQGFLIDDAKTYFDEYGNIRVHCGLDTTTGYYSGYISVLNFQMKNGTITEEQYNKLRTVKTPDKDGGIVHVDFANQPNALSNGDVQMICSGNASTVASGLPGIKTTGAVTYKSVVGGIVICVTKDVYEKKADILVKVLRALDDACAMIEDPNTVDEVSEYCAEYYGAEGWTAASQKKFFSGYYWDICNMKTMQEYLEEKAALINDDYAGHSYADLIKTDLVKTAHTTITRYDGLYTYDSDLQVLVEDPQM